MRLGRGGKQCEREESTIEQLFKVFSSFPDKKPS
jgi:hypothetical protein